MSVFYICTLPARMSAWLRPQITYLAVGAAHHTMAQSSSHLEQSNEFSATQMASAATSSGSNRAPLGRRCWNGRETGIFARVVDKSTADLLLHQYGAKSPCQMFPGRR